jgi:hypothetical protein
MGLSENILLALTVDPKLRDAVLAAIEANNVNVRNAALDEAAALCRAFGGGECAKAIEAKKTEGR